MLFEYEEHGPDSQTPSGRDEKDWLVTVQDSQSSRPVR